MSVLSRFRKSDETGAELGKLVTLDGDVLLCGLRVGSRPSDSGLKLMLKQCQHPQVRHLKKAQ